MTQRPCDCVTQQKSEPICRTFCRVKLLEGIYNRLLTTRCMIVNKAQHDELKSNLKKIPHRNRIWGLEAIVM